MFVISRSHDDRFMLIYRYMGKYISKCSDEKEKLIRQL